MMNCRQILKYLDRLLVYTPGAPLPPYVAVHIESCSGCQREHAVAKHTLTAIQPCRAVEVPAQLKERIMSTINDMNSVNSTGVSTSRRRIGPGKLMLGATGTAIALLLITALFHAGGPWRKEPASVLLSKAWAAEKELFTGEGVIHIINEIVVKPVSNPDLAEMRWLPIVSLDATGEHRFHQLALPAAPGEEYTVHDQAWYDPGTGRFVRLLSKDEKPVFANAYDGEAVFTLEPVAEATSQVVETPVSTDFQPPSGPARFFGITAGLPSSIDELREDHLEDAGDAVLDDGSKVRVIRTISADGAPEALTDSYWAFRIRQDDNTIAEMEWLIGEESMLLLRRIGTETVESPGVPWDLAGIENFTNTSLGPEKSGLLRFLPDMVIPNVSVQHMLKKAEYETYVFSANPSWAGERQIADILDVASPPHRMFAITYRADDGRHMVLIQGYTYNKMLNIARTGKLIYESPRGFKVWSGPRDKWLAGILLNSARAAIRDPASEDRTGYVIETPAETLPALAINGPVTDGELHTLIDSLVPAKEYTGK